MTRRDGPSATVAVERSAGFTSLRVNGKADASTAPADMPTQLMLGHLPLLLRPDARTTLVIGLGSGITAGAVSRHPVERLHVVETEPAMIEAASLFREEHGDVLADPRVRLIVGDARTVLLTASTRYDVITSEPSTPWIGGIATLFSLEFFRLPASASSPAGSCSSGFTPTTSRATTCAWSWRRSGRCSWTRASGRSAPGISCSSERAAPAPVNLHAVKNRYQANPAVRRDLGRIGVRGWAGLLGYFVLGPGDAARFGRGAALNTDDRLSLAFSAPRALYVDTHVENARALRRFATGGLPVLTAESLTEPDDPDSWSQIRTVRATLGIAN